MRFPKWIPNEVKDWFGKLKHEPETIHINLVTSYAMREVWEWFSGGRPHSTLKYFAGWSVETGQPVEIEEEKPSPTEFLIAMILSASFPGKPSDMTPKRREAYLSSVKKHALALIDLLKETEYDRSIFDEWGFIYGCAKPIDSETLEEKIINDIHGMIDWCRREDCILQADYMVDEEGEVYKLGWNYPNTELVHTLRDLADWASKDDYFDLMHSVKHLRQSGIQARKTHYLAQLDEHFKQMGIQVPIAHYATAANTALDLPENECLDEESARKQILRIRQRLEQTRMEKGRERGRFNNLDF